MRTIPKEDNGKTSDPRITKGATEMENFTITRRDFLKASAVTGAVAALYSSDMFPLKGLAEAKESAAGVGEVKVLKSVCRSCHGRQGCWALVHVRDGRVVKVEGDPECHYSLGTLCAMGAASLQILYNPMRLKYPMKRVGARGEGKWQRISWDEAIDTISKKWLDIREKYGPEFTVGIGGTGRPNDSSWANMFTTNLTPNFLDAGIVCYCCCTWVAETIGVVTRGQAVTFAGPSVDDSKLIMSVGSTNLGYGTGEATVKAMYWDGIIKENKKLIDVDPNFERNEASKADIFLPIRPGTDSALYLGMLNVIIAEDLYDKEFLREWTTGPFLVRIDPTKPLLGAGEDPGPLLTEADIKPDGKPTRYMVWDEVTKSLKYWDATLMPPPPPPAPPSPTYVLKWEVSPIKPALFGTYKVKLKDGREVECKPAWQILWDRVKEWTPVKASEITWIRADKIHEAAKLYATTKPATILTGVAIDHHISHTQTCRLLSILNAITGNLEYERLSASVPGLKGIPALFPRAEFTPEMHKKRIGAAKYPMFAKKMFFSEMLAPDAFIEAMLIGKPYKPKAISAWTGGGLWVPNQKEAFKAYKEAEFIFSVDQFMTPIAAISDIVLPANTWLEKDDVKSGENILKVCQKAAEPLWESKSDGQILIDLSRALGLAGIALPFKTYAEAVAERIKGTGYTWEELQKKDHVYPPPSEYPVARHKLGHWRRGVGIYADRQPGFPTPTGKLEIYSVKLKEWGYDPIYLHYVEPPESPYSTPKLAKEYPLILTTGKRSPFLFHSQHREVPWLRELFPAPLLDINPETADKLGIKDKDWVWIETPRGRVRHVAHLTNGTHPRVVQAYQHNWYYPEKPETPENPKGVFDSNINVLMDHVRTDPVSGNSVHRGLLCKVYKAVEGAPEGVWTKPEQFKPWLPQPPTGS
jgi:anaerobic selenocysteine-containing dehydrogenase